MKTLIEDRLQASINMDAINGDNMERAVVGLQMQEAIYEIRKLRDVIKQKEAAVVNKETPCWCGRLHKDSEHTLLYNYTSLEMSRKLVENGIVLETEKVWAFVPGDITKPDSPGKWALISKPLYPYKEQYPAPNLSELWRELPEGSRLKMAKGFSIAASAELLIWVRKEGIG